MAGAMGASEWRRWEWCQGGDASLGGCLASNPTTGDVASHPSRCDLGQRSRMEIGVVRQQPWRRTKDTIRYDVDTVRYNTIFFVVPYYFRNVNFWKHVMWMKNKFAVYLSDKLWRDLFFLMLSDDLLQLSKENSSSGCYWKFISNFHGGLKNRVIFTPSWHFSRLLILHFRRPERARSGQCTGSLSSRCCDDILHFSAPQRWDRTALDASCNSPRYWLRPFVWPWRCQHWSR